MINKEEPKIGDIWQAPNYYLYLVTDISRDKVMLSALHNPNITPVVEWYSFFQHYWTKK